MANKVNLRAEEYQTIQTELSKMHETQIQNIAQVITEFKALVTAEEAFKADKTSDKIVEMLDAVSLNTVNLLQYVFKASEAGVANMITAAKETDTTYK